MKRTIMKISKISDEMKKKIENIEMLDSGWNFDKIVYTAIKFYKIIFLESS